MYTAKVIKFAPPKLFIENSPCAVHAPVLLC